jgi:ubiquinone/menaquinone biosynthesis C-methylase UbiE
MLKVKIISEKNIVDECLEELTRSSKIILDIGGEKPFNKMLARYRDLFNNIKYYCLDICLKKGLSVVGDAEKLPIKSESLDGIICHAVLEHLFEPQIAVREIHRVLKSGGLGFFYIPFLYPYHGGSQIKDCYRFTKDGLLYMFKDFEYMKVQPQDGYLGVTLRFLSGFSRISKRVYLIEKFLEKIITLFRKKRFNRMNNNSGFIFLVKK